ncbi:tRNA (adenosine(37)-N6)-threonylcarbamoyltransferase complex ATPase subunit type 1 TsaE [Sphingomonas sp. BN140010]|uniref:tRNA threonylcarbamoyladenosine biosynthesis protein TsaE n=1 Tax=Sphingomonas arvum TaxID=2992113 RepID=A0ABT3JDG1_9SPHN|nr:tRNA (adenosine(37)-N6)-threonylcarbamoyltransferase complex ATPase subunit type 1 TsaE [Sphingomonas sp. BN140010]MCW3797054.1 tRNA (adenosine(37)-N6)-threonylcarbamoyltransferase complex ATPase subunit type 1 TsaE [Sphingomonas sp. BN140010]
MILVDEQATEAVGRQLAQALRPGDVIALSGALGVGKTALSRAILHAAGHDGEVPSPTFAIVQPYDDLPVPIWHCDLYRLEDPSELDELGLDGGLDGILLVEWPEKAGAAAWPQALRLSLEFAADGQRRLTWEVPAAWEGRWPPA